MKRLKNILILVVSILALGFINNAAAARLNIKQIAALHKQFDLYLKNPTQHKEQLNKIIKQFKHAGKKKIADQLTKKMQAALKKAKKKKTKSKAKKQADGKKHKRHHAKNEDGKKERKANKKKGAVKKRRAAAKSVPVKPAVRFAPVHKALAPIVPVRPAPRVTPAPTLRRPYSATTAASTNAKAIVGRPTPTAAAKPSTVAFKDLPLPSVQQPGSFKPGTAAQPQQSVARPRATLRRSQSIAQQQRPVAPQQSAQSTQRHTQQRAQQSLPPATPTQRSLQQASLKNRSATIKPAQKTVHATQARTSTSQMQIPQQQKLVQLSQPGHTMRPSDFMGDANDIYKFIHAQPPQPVIHPPKVPTPYYDSYLKDMSGRTADDARKKLLTIPYGGSMPRILGLFAGAAGDIDYFKACIAKDILPIGLGDTNGNDSLDLATLNNHIELVQLILDNMSRENAKTRIDRLKKLHKISPEMKKLLENYTSSRR